MEKKIYNKPEVNQTKLDSSINILLVSCLPEDFPCNGQEVPNPDGEIFMNPFKWFK
jgi:hypothetical protein